MYEEILVLLVVLLKLVVVAVGGSRGPMNGIVDSVVFVLPHKQKKAECEPTKGEPLKVKDGEGAAAEVIGTVFFFPLSLLTGPNPVKVG